MFRQCVIVTRKVYFLPSSCDFLDKDVTTKGSFSYLSSN